MMEKKRFEKFMEAISKTLKGKVIPQQVIESKQIGTFRINKN